MSPGQKEMSKPAIKSQRTKIRNNLMKQIEVVENVNPDTALVDGGLSMRTTLNLITGLFGRLETLDHNLFTHSDIEEQEMQDEVEFAAEFETRVQATVARLQAIIQTGNSSLHELSTLSSSNRPLIPGVKTSHELSTPFGGSRLAHPIGFHSHSTPQGLTEPLTGTLPTASQLSNSQPARIHKELDTAPEKFDGSRLRYHRFITLFKSWISKYPELTDLERLTVLVKYLKGEPKDLVEVLEPTSANYAVALSILDENYARVDTEKQRILAELRNLPRVKKATNISGLRTLLTLVQRHMASLTAMEISFDSFALLLKSSLEAALPLDVRQKFRADCHRQDQIEALTISIQRLNASTSESSTTQTASTLEKDPETKEARRLIEFLRRYVIENEDAMFVDEALNPGCSKEPDAASNKPNKEPKSKGHTATVAGVRTTKATQRGKLPCLFCNTPEHRSSKCAAKMSLDKRREILKKLKRCVRCFRPEHATESECSGPRFPCSVCKTNLHYTAMHSQATNALATQATAQIAAAVLPESSADTSSAIMQTASAYIVDGGRKIPVRLFLDAGSSDSFICPRVRKLLKDERPLYRATMSVQAFGSKHQLSVDKFKIRLASTYTGNVFECAAYEAEFGVDPHNEHPATVTRAIEDFGASHPIADRSLLDEWPRDEPALLLGQDCLNRLTSINAPRTVIGDIRAVETVFGWAVGGPVRGPSMKATVTSIQVACCKATLSPPAKALQQLWAIEAIGIKDVGKESPLSLEDESAVQQFHQGLKYDGQRYTVSFPKRESIANLSNNKALATERLMKKVKQLSRDPAKYARYHQEIMKFVEDGYACQIDEFPAGAQSQCDESYFMPHHCVVTGIEPNEKHRIVFDCSAKEVGRKSLNECLIPGPNLNADLVTLLLNFRLYPVAVSTDITKAYMRIAVNDRDQKYFRFLWRPPGEMQDKVFQMRRVTWGAASSAFILAATLREHFKRNDQTAKNRFGDYLYADDFLRSFRNAEEAIEFTDSLRGTLKMADMNLAKWKTNSEEMRHHLVNTGVDPASIDGNMSNIFKVLGVLWDPKEDSLKFNFADIFSRVQKDGCESKRSVLSLVASVYDPLGMLCPFTLRGKLLIQKLWASNLSWSDPISAESRAEALKWTNELKVFESFSACRRYSNDERQPIAFRLHVFGDASPCAYACAAFVESRFVDGESQSCLAMAKSRLAPKDAQTLPRLELLAALLASRLKDFLIDRWDVEFESISLYTDSMITYHWVTAASPEKWKPFVANRVAEIQRRSTVESWFFVPGDKNIADLATRGVSAETLVESREWWTGPVWLSSPLHEQPVSRPGLDDGGLESVRVEIRANVAATIALPITFNFEKFSSARRATRVLALALRFIYLTRKKEVPLVENLTEEAENHIIRWTQEKTFAEEIRAVRASEPVPSKSKIAAFRLFIDERGVLRAGTRLTRGPHFTYDEKNPVIIAGDSRLASMLVYDAHRANAHFGVNTVLNFLRRKFWVTRARQVVKTLLRQCVICRKRQAAAAQQIEAPLPCDRVTLTAPFNTTGLDYCGPFFAKSREGTLKMYCAIFTCASVRAVHLEVVPSQATPQTHLAIRRFLSLYPACKRLESDNARSFVKAATDIKRLFNTVKDRQVRDLLAEREIEWRFICPRAAWRGGYWEIIVRSVKSALTKTLGRSLIGYEEFRTIIYEIAAIINDRPLVAASTDIDEPCALTPAQFLRGGPQTSPLASHLDVDRLGPNGAPPGDELRSKFKERTTYFKNLAVRWQREYMLQLRSANQTRGSLAEPIEVGEVCLVRDDNKPRVKWDLVRIMEAHKGRDGLIRTYTVRFANGSVTRRAAQLLCPLEVKDQEHVSEAPRNESS